MYRQRSWSLGWAIISGWGMLALLLVLLSFAPASPVFAFGGDYALAFNDDSFVRLGVPGVDTEDQIFGESSTWTTTKSISVWIRPLGPSPTENNVGRLQHIAGNSPRWFGISRGIFSGQDRIWVWNTRENTTNSDLIGIEYEIGEWVHIVMVHDNDTLYAYKNGNLAGSTTTAPTQVPNPGSTNRYLAFGGSRTDRLNFDGQIDEVAFWSIDLSQAEIREWVYREITEEHPQWNYLAAYYRMSDGAGTTVTDNGPNNHTGTVYMADSEATPVLHWVSSGAFAGPGNALQFSGGTSYVSVPHDAALDQAGDLTVELWVNGSDWNNNLQTPFLVKGDGATPAINYYAGKSANNELAFIYANDGPILITDTSGVSFENNTWYHLAYVVDTAGNEVRFYRNGRLLSQVAHDFSAAPLLTNSHDLTLGHFLNAGDAAFNGLIDEVRIWSAARSAGELQQYMFQTLAGTEGNLVVYYRFDQYNATDQTILYDVTANNRHGALQNIDPNAAWVAGAAFNTWIGSNGEAWSDGNNWSRYTPPDAADNAGIPGYPAAQTPIISSPVALKNLYIAPAAALTISVGGVLTVGEGLHTAGALHNNGQLLQTLPVSGATDVHFLDSGTYGGVAINANGGNLGDTLVSIRGNQECTTVPGETVLRCIDISPTNSSGQNANVTFYFREDELGAFSCADVEAYRWNGNTWDPLTLDTRDCANEPYSIRVSGVSDFSPFALAGSAAPTAITLLHIGSAPAPLQAGFILALLLLSLVTALSLASGRMGRER